MPFIRVGDVMQRYFIMPEQIKDNYVEIVGDDVKHISRVMRMTAGNQIICSNNNDKVLLCEIVSVTPDIVKASIIRELDTMVELPIKVTIAQGLPKGDKLDLIIQKGTELGAGSFIPFSSSRSVVKWDEKKQEKKLERLQKIAKEAAEQAHRNVIPTVRPLHSLKQLIAEGTHYDVALFAYEEAGRTANHHAFNEVLTTASRGSSLLVLIGPEGGFSLEEARNLQEAGFVPCSLGPRILRTETAGLYVLSAVSYHFELMR